MKRALWKRLTDPLARLFGDDIFISHSHADAAEYGFVLASRLNRHLEAYVDRFSQRPGADISEEVKDHLMRATMLVVVASPESATRESRVGEEVEEFWRTGRRIMAVNVDDALKDCWWEGLVNGLSTPTEEKARLKPARPSPEVRLSILRAFDYVTRAKLRRRLSLGLVTGTFVVASILGAVSWRAGIQADEAAHLEAAAATRTEIADLAEKRAKKREADAAAEAERQRGMASSQRIANSAEEAWRSSAADVDEVLLASAEALRRGPAAAAFRLVSEVLPLRPVPVTRWPLKNAGKLALSNDERWLAVFDSGNEVFLFDLQAGGKMWRVPQCRGVWAVFDPGSQHVAFTCFDEKDKAQVQVLDLATKKMEKIEGGGESGGVVSFLPGGGYLFVNETGDAVSVEARAKNHEPLPLPIRNPSPGRMPTAPKTASAFAVQTTEHDVDVRDGITLEPVFATIHTDDCIAQVAYSGDARKLAIAVSSCDKENREAPTEVIVRDAGNAAEIGRFTVELRSKALILSQDGRDIAVVTESYVGTAEPAQLHVYRDWHGTGLYDSAWERPLSNQSTDRIAFLPPDSKSNGPTPLAFVDDYALHVVGDHARERFRLVGAGNFVVTKDRLIVVVDDAVSVWRHPSPERLPTVRPAVWPAIESWPAVKQWLKGREAHRLDESRDGRYAVLALDEAEKSELVLVDVASRQIMDRFSLPAAVWFVAIAVDGSMIAAVSADADMNVVVRDSARQRDISHFAAGPVRTALYLPLAISRQADSLAFGIGGGVEVRDLHGAMRWRMGMDLQISDLRFDSGGQRLVIAAGSDPLKFRTLRSGLITVTDASFGTVLYQSQMPGPIHRVTFEGTSRLVVEDSDHGSRTLQMDPIETARTICRTVGGRLDAGQWTQLIRGPYVDTCREIERSRQ